MTEINKRRLGDSGVAVYPVGLGGMPLSLSGRPDEDAAVEVIRTALEAGVDLIDTANSYCIDERDVGHNERLIAHALDRLGAAGRVHVATKGGLIRPRGAWHVDARPEALAAACEQSLHELGTETIWLYQLHAPDSRVPYADSVGALARLREAGKIRHVGLSNVSVAQIRQAQRIVPVTSVQNRCNVQDRSDLNNGVLAHCAAEGIAYIAYSPVGGHFGHKSLGRHRVLGRIASRHGVSPQQVMLAWLLGLGQHVIPIPGASRPASIRDSAAAAALTLDPEDAQQLARL